MLKETPISEMPMMERDNLIDILEKQKAFHNLAIEMKFTEKQIAEMKRLAIQKNYSDSKVLLLTWGDRLNHKIWELFIVLSRIQNYEAMDCIKHLVDKRIHKYMKPPKIPTTSIISRTNNESLKSPAADQKLVDIDDLNYLNGQKLTYEKLRIATNDWNENCKLGQGGFGSVYKVEWLGTWIAVKRLDVDPSKPVIKKTHLNELRALNSCRSDHILSLYGYCFEEGKPPCLYSQYMAGGSLENRLSIKSKLPPLTWKDRVRIAAGTAKGLRFLHYNNVKPLIHGDIKPGNILLDKCNEPKIGDFGLAREGAVNDEEIQVSTICGTKHYLPQEFLDHMVFSTKIDVYSFGIVLLEITTGKRAYHSEYKYLKDYVRTFDEESSMKLMDKKAADEENCEYIFKQMFNLGKKCSSSQDKRPDMEIVSTKLTLIGELYYGNTIN